MSQFRLKRSGEGVAADASSLPRKSDRTRKAILDSALEFLWLKPFREMTVAELTLIAGVSRSAFYRYFDDLHGLMETLLLGLEEDIFEAAAPWFGSEGDPVALLRESLGRFVSVRHARGLIVRAVTDASTTDERLERSWAAFLLQFDDAITANIELQQARGLIPTFDTRPVAVALNRLDASLVIHCFGRHPRQNPEVVLDTLARISHQGVEKGHPLWHKDCAINQLCANTRTALR